MKASLQQALTGKSLRTDIFNTFSNRTLNQFSPFLKRSRQRDSRYLPYSSQHTVIRSQMDSPNIRTDFSSNRFSPSPPTRFVRDGMPNSSAQISRAVKIQRIKDKKESSSRQKHNKKKGSSKDSKGKNSKQRIRRLCESGSGSGSRSNKKISSKGKNREAIKNKQKDSNSEEKSKKHKSKDSKINLSSIIQHQSQDKTIPSAHISKQNKRYHQEKTHKKSKVDQLSQIVCKRIQKLCRQPQKYLRLLKNEIVSIRYKLQRRKIIEFEITIYKDIYSLAILLQKGNLQCQHIQQKYYKLTANTKINLFTCVREVDLQQPFKLPKIFVQINLDDNSVLDRYATIPYTWMHFCSQVRHRQHKSRIITKTYLQNIHINPNHLRSLSLILPVWKSKSLKTESCFQSQFTINENDFQLLICEQRGVWSMELSGRKEERLYKLIQFLCKFLC